MASIAGIDSDHLHIDFLRRNRDGVARYLVKFELGIAHVDIVRRWIRDRTVDAEDSELDLLTRLHVTSDDQPVLSVPTFDHRTAALSGSARQLSIHPDFGVVVEGCSKYQCRARWIEIANSLRNRDLDPVPVEGESSGGAAFIQCRRDR